MTTKRLKMKHVPICRLPRFLMAGLFVFFVACVMAAGLHVFPASAQTARKYNVLVLNSYHKGFWPTDDKADMIERTLSDSLDQVEVYVEYMDTKRVFSSSYLDFLHDYMAVKYKDVPLDVIMASDDAALTFLLDHRDEIFGPVPVVFSGINDYHPELLGGDCGYTGLVEVLDIIPTINIARSFHPGLNRVIVVDDDSPTGRGKRTEVKAIAKTYDDLAFEYLNGGDMSTSELLDELGNAPDDSIVLLLIWMRDREGRYIHQNESTRMISLASKVPVYGLTPGKLGFGIVGGKLLNPETHGRGSADMALRIIRGEKAGDIPVVTTSVNPYMFDYDEIRRWGIDEEFIPESSIVINRPVTFYSQHKVFVWTVVSAFATLTGLVVLLAAYILYRRKMEAALEDSETKYRTLFESSRDALGFAAPDGTIIDVNQTWLDMFCYTRREAVGRNIEMIYNCPDERLLFFEELASKGFTRDYSLTLKNKNGQLLDCLVTANICKVPGGHDFYYQTNTRDITERKRLEEQLRQAQKMETVGRLAGGIAHDFNNILTAIIGNADLVLAMLPERCTVTDEIQDIINNAQRAALLTKQLLGYSRRQIIQPHTVNLNDHLMSLDSMLRRLIGERIEYITSPSPDLWQIKIDPGQIEQVMTNLVVNARDAMPEGGSLIVRTSNVVVDEDMASRHSDAVPGQYVQLDVIDSGIGMDDELIQNIFEPFFTTKDVGKGTGLGLATCYGIVRQNNGFIVVESESGRGTVFSIYLPSTERDVAKLPTVDSVQKSGGETGTILVVEDDDSVRFTVVKSLEHEGFSMLEASDGIDALNVLKAHDGVMPDVVVTDIVMPHMGGVELAKRLEKDIPGVGLVFITGYTDKIPELEKASIEGAQLVRKPFTFSRLTAAIRKVMND